MNKKIALLTAVTLLFMPFFSQAAIPLTNPGGTYDASVDFMDVLTNVANFIIGLITVAGIIFIVYGGLLYITSAGDEKRAEEGKTTITYAALGLFLAAMAYAIERLILVSFVS